MMRVIRAAAAAIGLSLLAVGAVAAADDYTLPFTNPDVVMSYGVDRDARACVQVDWTGQTWWDCSTHWGRSYDNHTGQDYLMGTGSTVVAARDGTVIDYAESNPSTPGPWGNFVLVEHADGVRTLYYHLSKDGALVTRQQKVKAGQKIAISGCSGNCHGEHLHYEVLVNGRFTDPHADRRWTTWPARVPYLGAYVGENNPNTVAVQRGRTVTHWVEFRNNGGRPWRNDLGVGGLMLATWNPALHSSAFRAADWYSSTVPTKVDQRIVYPGGVGRFTFGIKGGPIAGNYVEAYNLLANTVSWFDWGRLSGFVVPIRVTNFAP